MSTPPDEKLVYWHRELPPLDLSPAGEALVEARSVAVPYSEVEHDALWGRCTDSLKEAATERLEQEVRRQGAACAHVIDEEVAPRVDFGRNEYRLEGRYTYVLYRR